MLLITQFRFRQSCKVQGVGLNDTYGSLCIWDIPWFYELLLWTWVYQPLSRLIDTVNEKSFKILASPMKCGKFYSHLDVIAWGCWWLLLSEVTILTPDYCKKRYSTWIILWFQNSRYKLLMNSVLCPLCGFVYNFFAVLIIVSLPQVLWIVKFFC